MKSTLIKTLLAILLFASPIMGSAQIAPNLNSAADFAILAGTAISFAPPTSIINDMDIGLYPGFRSSITGDVANLTLVNGVILAADTDPTNRLPKAKLDLLNAYLFAAAAPVTKPTISGSQGGLTLYPGVYKSATILSIEGSPLTLDAQGNENAVWIFQIGSTLTTTVGGSITLTGGAKANNVYWQVGSSATIGSGTSFKGNILALESITVGSGANIEGRLLARNAAVTFAGGGIINEPEESQAVPGNLTITKTADPQTFSAVGNEIDYEIVVTNIGTVTMTNITVTDPLFATSPWSIPTLGPGASQTFTPTHIITPTDLQNGYVSNIATAVTGDISESASAYVVVTREGLLISKVATPNTFYAPGQVINYDIVVDNIGTVTATNITVVDNKTNVVWENVTLGPGESRIFKTSYTILESDMLAGSVENTATAVMGLNEVSDTEIIVRSVPLPLSTWALVLGGLLIVGFMAFQYRRSTLKRV